MELLVATWALRLAIVAALAVGGVSISAGTPVLDSMIRALAAAFAFTLGGRWFLGWMEPPELRLQRMRQKREARRAKSAKSGKSGKSGKAGRDDAPAKTSTISRTA